MNIVEKRLNIPADYQVKAINSPIYAQANWHRNKLLALRYLVGWSKEDKVLDVGTGSGNFELDFYSQLKSIVGIDYNDEAIEYLKGQLKERNISNVNVLVLGIQNLDELSGKFDKIIMIDVIEHISKSDADKMIHQFYKLLNPYGVAIIITPNYHSLWSVIEKLFDLVHVVPHFSGEQHISRYDSEKLVDAFDRSHWDLLKLTSFNSWFFMPSKWLNEKMCRMEIRSEGKWGNLLAGIFQRRL